MSSRSNDALQVSFEFARGRVRCTVTGDLIRDSVPLLFETVRAILTGGDRVVIDLTATTMIDSAALGCAARLHQVATERGVSVEFVTGRNFQRRVFEVANLDGYLQIVHEPVG
ncbi:STAS domain-containing protein [Ilumatobacter sp.]|uniref:STAS domain-containing protein n=1 Tax=Ilumatobacter sp. TaxID=1967498 RepID=UPI003C53F583